MAEGVAVDRLLFYYIAMMIIASHGGLGGIFEQLSAFQ